jgi:Set1/Ash2 histone methyltransferase complex subunit ASH2
MTASIPGQSANDSSSNEDERRKAGKKKPKVKKTNEKPTDSLPQVCLSVRFRDKRVKLSDDRFGATGDRGYTTVLATHPATRGKWYYEVTFEPTDPSAVHADSHIRLGWSTRRTRYDMPIGSDIFSYAIRDLDGAKIVQGCRFDYSKVGGFKQGDVIGCLLTLPDEGNSSVVIDYEDPTWLPGLLCDPQYPPGPGILQGSQIEWFVNGKRLGVAFIDLVEGAYYPAVSLFMKAKATMNFGPSFKHQPPAGFRAVAELFDPESHLKPPRRPPTFLPRGLLAGQQK